MFHNGFIIYTLNLNYIVVVWGAHDINKTTDI